MHAYIHVVFERISRMQATVTWPQLPMAHHVPTGMAAAAATVRHCLKLGAGTTTYLSARLCWHAAQVPAGHSSLWFETAPTCD